MSQWVYSLLSITQLNSSWLTSHNAYALSGPDRWIRISNRCFAGCWTCFPYAAHPNPLPVTREQHTGQFRGSLWGVTAERDDGPNTWQTQQNVLLKRTCEKYRFVSMHLDIWESSVLTCMQECIYSQHVPTSFCGTMGTEPWVKEGLSTIDD